MTLPSNRSAAPQPERPADAGAARRPTVAYVMNGYPRLSETFITHEIHQLERLGLALRLYSVKRENEPQVHPVVAAIRAPLTYLPKATSLSGTTLAGWLRDNLPRFWRAHALVALRHPLRWSGALASALALAWRHRGREEAGRVRLRKVFIKEFLQAGEIAADVLRQGDVGHLHGHFCHGVATITWLASRMTGIGYSFTAHAKDIYQAELNPGRLLERKLGAARFVATCTCANAEVLRARHARPDEVHAIYHGLDTDYFLGHYRRVLDPAVAAVEWLRPDGTLLAVDIEVEFSPMYQEQPLFADVDTHLRKAGLQLMDLAPRRSPHTAGAHLNLARGQIVWAEAVYFPTLDWLASDVSARGSGGPDRLAKACLVALSYGLPDFALALTERCAVSVGASVLLTRE